MYITIMFLGKRHQARTSGLWYIFKQFTRFIYVIILPYILVKKTITWYICP